MKSCGKRGVSERRRREYNPLNGGEAAREFPSPITRKEKILTWGRHPDLGCFPGKKSWPYDLLDVIVDNRRGSSCFSMGEKSLGGPFTGLSFRSRPNLSFNEMKNDSGSRVEKDELRISPCQLLDKRGGKLGSLEPADLVKKKTTTRMIKYRYNSNFCFHTSPILLQKQSPKSNRTR